MFSLCCFMRIYCGRQDWKGLICLCLRKVPSFLGSPYKKHFKTFIFQCILPFPTVLHSETCSCISCLVSAAGRVNAHSLHVAPDGHDSSPFG